MKGTLTVSSDKLFFGATTGCIPTRPANGGFTAVACHMTLDRSSNTVYVDMRSRASGDFRVSVALQSPSASLTMVATQFTVRSISTSAVAIALSAGAAASCSRGGAARCGGAGAPDAAPTPGAGGRGRPTPVTDLGPQRTGP